MRVRKHYLRTGRDGYWYLISENNLAYYNYLMDIPWEEWSDSDDIWVDQQRIESPYNIPILMTEAGESYV